MIDLFSQLPDCHAIVRLPKGVYKQTGVYLRGSRFYVPHGSGYIEIRGRDKTGHYTSHPDVRVIDLELHPEIPHYTEHELGLPVLRYGRNDK